MYICILCYNRLALGNFYAADEMRCARPDHVTNTADRSQILKSTHTRIRIENALQISDLEIASQVSTCFRKMSPRKL